MGTADAVPNKLLNTYCFRPDVRAVAGARNPNTNLWMMTSQRHQEALCQWHPSTQLIQFLDPVL